MKTIFFALPLVLGLTPLVLPVFAQTTQFTYQGRLVEGTDAANGLFDLGFTLRSAPTGDSPIGPAVFTNQVPISNGLFLVTLDFGSAAFDGSRRWLEITVHPSGSGAPPVRLSPRQELTATPCAINAANLMSPGNQLDIKANGRRVLRLEPGTNGPNIIGGFAQNSVLFGVYGATIAGGGTVFYHEDDDSEPAPNMVRANFGTVGGGAGNTAGGFASVVAGGTFNVVGNDSSYSLIAGGTGNSIQQVTYASSIGGGFDNVIEPFCHAVNVAGGALNHIETTAQLSAISGGVGIGSRPEHSMPRLGVACKTLSAARA